MLSPTFTPSCFARSCAEHDAVVVVLVPRLQVLELARDHRFLDVGDGRLELGLDTLEADERIGAADDAIARPMSAGAAPTTRGILRSASISAR